jgi:exonuclease III
MKLLSLNCRGLVSPLKKLTLKRLMSVNQPNLLLLQETLGKGSDIEKLLVSIFPGWSFSCIDVSGRSGGLELWDGIIVGSNH